MPDSLELKISWTESPQFLRLIEFATEVTLHAQETLDDGLAAIIQRMADDLLEMGGAE